MDNNLFQIKYRIPSARADWHDYKNGMYFTTICTKDRECYFGNIANGEMRMTKIGIFAQEQLQNITNHYSYVEVPLWVVMPNHIHLVASMHSDNVLGSSVCRDAINRVSTVGGITGLNNPMLTNSLGTVIRGFKARVTHFARANFIHFAWQPRFYDRIIRNTDELNHIAEYIVTNVAKWEFDKFYRPL